MKNFGGDWTEKKIKILIDYAKAYLVIMNKYPLWKLIYFDGFAGSGIIEKNDEANEIIYGSAIRILEISEPKPFDLYYFVEKDNRTYADLIKNTKDKYPDKEIHLVQEDCNVKLKSMADFLRSNIGKNYKVLAYIDPYGMQLEWNSLESLKNLPIDLWILAPTGIGANRLLKNNGDIKEVWLKKLEVFLGISKESIKQYFYKDITLTTLFGEEEYVIKLNNSIKEIGLLYQERLKELFKYVSNPFELKNSTNSIMYHLFMASNNPYATKIGNDIINKR